MLASLASYSGFIATAFAACGTMKVSRCYGRQTLWGESLVTRLITFEYLVTEAQQCMASRNRFDGS